MSEARTWSAAPRVKLSDQQGHVGDIGRGRNADHGVLGRIRRSVAGITDMGGAEIARHRAARTGAAIGVARGAQRRRPPAFGIEGADRLRGVGRRAGVEIGADIKARGVARQRPLGRRMQWRVTQQLLAWAGAECRIVTPQRRDIDRPECAIVAERRDRAVVPIISAIDNIGAAAVDVACAVRADLDEGRKVPPAPGGIGRRPRLAGSARMARFVSASARSFPSLSPTSQSVARESRRRRRARKGRWPISREAGCARWRKRKGH